MDMHHIRYFLAACETLNFTRAAEICNVTQPALTRAIRHLEDEFGAPLFHRERRNTQLTDLGRLIRDHLAAIEDQAQAARIAADQLLNLEKAPLNLGVMCTIGPQQVMGFLGAFFMEHPGIELTVHDSTPTRLTEDLLSGKLDCALLGLPTPLPERFDCHPLYSEPMVVIIPPGHRLARMNAVPFDELAGERYLDRLHCEFRGSFFKLLEERDMELAVPFRSEREDWIQNMALAGMGVCVMPEYSVTLEGLECRPIIDPILSRRVEVVAIAGRHHSPAMRAFVADARGHDWGESMIQP